MSKIPKNFSDYKAENKREEIEQIIQSKRDFNQLEEESVSIIAEYVEEKIYPFTLNANGMKGIEQLYRKFDHSDIIDAVDLSASKYLKYNADNEVEKDSVEDFVKKIGGILNLMNRPPIDQKIAYVKGICRNRFDYWNERNGTAILKDYVESLRCCNYSEHAIIEDFEQEVIPETKNARNWSQWRNLIEGWTEQLYARSKEQQSYNEDFDEDIDQAVQAEDNQYIEEKRKGGANSYQAYKPLRDKVEELCINEMNQVNYSSASQLCNKVAGIIEEHHPELLSSFQPYQNHAREGNDWKRPTFYGWCNVHYKARKT